MIGAGTLPRFVFSQPKVAPIRPDREHELTLPDGRRLGAAEFGPRSSLPLVYLHGFLGSRLEPGAIDRRYVNIIGLDRPGYGRSDPQRQGPSLAAFGRDVRDGLDRLGVERCVLAGISAGAPYAVAAALALGSRVPRLVLVAGVGGPDVLLRTRGTADVIVRLAGERWGGGRMLHGWFRMARRTGLDRTLLGLAVTSELRSLARHGLTGSFVHERLLQSLRTGNDRWLRGVAADARLLTRPWDVDPAALRTDTLVLHGTADPAVPVEHAYWYGARLPRARVEILPGERHFSLCFASTDTIQRIVQELAAATPDDER